MTAMRIGGAGALRRPLLGLVLAVGGFVLLAGTGEAATVPVSSAEQLQNAVREARSGDTIVLAAGIYAPDAPLRLKADVTLAGPTAEGPPGRPPGAILSGGNLDDVDVVTVDPGASVAVRNLSLRLAPSNGAAIFVGGSLKLEDAELSQNNSNAAIVVDDGATLAATNTTIAGNTGGAVDVFGTATFVNATVADNSSAG